MQYYFQTPFIQLENYELDVDVVKIIPEEMARCFQVIALEKQEEILTVGMVNPKDINVISILEHKLNCKIIPIKVEIQVWANAVNTNYINERSYIKS